MDKSKKARMQELVELLNKAGRAYYQDAEEIIVALTNVTNRLLSLRL